MRDSQDKVNWREFNWLSGHSPSPFTVFVFFFHKIYFPVYANKILILYTGLPFFSTFNYYSYWTSRNTKSAKRILWMHGRYIGQNPTELKRKTKSQ